MFHRVKSETQPEENAAPKRADQKSADVTEFKRPEQDEQPEIADIELETADDVVSEETAETPTEEQQPETPTQTEEEDVEMTQDIQEDHTEQTQEAAPAAVYQPTNTAPTRGYPGAYPGYAATEQEEQAPAAEDRRLTIGAGITMSGEIESCDYLLVEGTVEAALKGASVLDIAETGVFYGTVEIEDATIAGRFEGDITAQGRLTLREGATVTGTIAYKEIEIEAGAVIDGKLTPLQAVQAAAVPRPAAKKAAPAAKVTKAAEKPVPANTDGGLFTKTAAVAE